MLQYINLPFILLLDHSLSLNWTNHSNMVDWQDFYTAVRGMKLYLNFDFLVYLWRAAFKSGDSLSSNWIGTLGLKIIKTKTTKEGLLIINMQVHFVPRLVYPSKNPSPPARLLPPQGSSLPGYNLLLPILWVGGPPVRGCSHIMSAKNWGSKPPLPPLSAKNQKLAYPPPPPLVRKNQKLANPPSPPSYHMLSHSN